MIRTTVDARLPIPEQDWESRAVAGRADQFAAMKIDRPKPVR